MAVRSPSILYIFRNSMDDYQVHIEAVPVYLSEQSEPGDDLYYFSYTVTITNFGNIAVQVISRHWVIADENGRVEEVNSLGILGQQPLLKPDQVFEYTSGTRLQTPKGSMKGKLFLVAEDGERFEADIPAFELDANATSVEYFIQSTMLH